MAPNKLPAALAATEEDISTHIGAKNLDKQMTPYVWKRRSDGIHLINLGKTWEKLVFAARIIAAIDNPNDVCIISARPYGHRAALKFAANTGAQAVAGRYTPGSLTNYIVRQFKEPRLIIVTDPRSDNQAIREASYCNVPVIAIADTDSSIPFVDVVIPANNKGKHSLGLILWMLCREVLRLRGTYARSGENAWNVMPDMFFYRDPEETEQPQDKAAAGYDAGAGEQAAPEWEVSGAPVGPTLAAGQSAIPGQVDSGLDWAADAAAVSDWAAHDGAGQWEAAGHSGNTQAINPPQAIQQPQDAGVPAGWD